MNYFVPEIFRPIYIFNNYNFSYFYYGNPLLSQIDPSAPINIKIPPVYKKKRPDLILVSDLKYSAPSFSPQNTPNYNYTPEQTPEQTPTFFEFNEDIENILLETKSPKFIKYRYASKKYRKNKNKK